MTPAEYAAFREDAKRLESIRRELAESQDIETVRASALAMISDRIKRLRREITNQPGAYK